MDITYQNATYIHMKFLKDIFKELACTLRSAVTTSSTEEAEAAGHPSLISSSGSVPTMKILYQ